MKASDRSLSVYVHSNIIIFIISHHNYGNNNSFFLLSSSNFIQNFNLLLLATLFNTRYDFKLATEFRLRNSKALLYVNKRLEFKE